MKTLYWLSLFGGIASSLIFLITVLEGLTHKYSPDWQTRMIGAYYGSVYFFQWRYLIAAIACFIVMATV